MTRVLAALMAGLLASGPAFAQTEFVEVDADASGDITFIEASAVIPDLTEPEFIAADADQDGALSIGEYESLRGSKNL